MPIEQQPDFVSGLTAGWLGPQGALGQMSEDIQKRRQARLEMAMKSSILEQEAKRQRELYDYQQQITPIFAEGVGKATGLYPSNLKESEQAISLARARQSASGAFGLPEEDIQNIVEQMAQGDVTVSMVGGRGPQKAKILSAYERLRKQKPGLLSPIDLENMYKSEQSLSRTLNSQQMINQRASIDQFFTAADGALSMSEEIPRGDFVPLNALKQKVIESYQAKSPMAEKYAKFNALVLELSLQGGQVFTGNALTDVRFKNEVKRLNTAQSPEQFRSIVETLKQIASTRKNSLSNPEVSYIPGANPPPQQGMLGQAVSGIVGGVKQALQQPEQPKMDYSPSAIKEERERRAALKAKRGQ